MTGEQGFAVFLSGCQISASQGRDSLSEVLHFHATLLGYGRSSAPGDAEEPVEEPGSSIEGQVHLHSDLDELDFILGYYPENKKKSRTLRKKVMVDIGAGGAIQAYVYELNPNRPKKGDDW